MFAIQDRSQMALIVAGKDILLGAADVSGCTVIEDVKAGAPSVHIDFIDKRKTTQDLGIFQDGTKLQLIMGDGKGGNPIQYEFLQWALSDATVGAAGPSAKISGVANVMPWISKEITKAHKGSSSSVVQKLAQEAGISKVEVEPTLDHMTWLPDGRVLGSFLRNLVDRAWMGAGKCPHMAMTSDKGQWSVRLKDIMKQGSASTTFASVGLNGQSDIPVWAFVINTRGGALNSHTTYGHKVVQEKLAGTVDVWSQFTFNKSVAQIGISSTIQAAVGIARTFFHPPDIGNAHAQYAQALHSNRMARSTFSSVVTILTDVQTTVKLMDDVTVKLANADGSINGPYSGTYKVTNIARHMASGNYMEKITVSSQGTGQAAGANTPSAGAAASATSGGTGGIGGQYPASWGGQGSPSPYTIGNVPSFTGFNF